VRMRGSLTIGGYKYNYRLHGAGAVGRDLAA
jgi:hypothetical protein